MTVPASNATISWRWLPRNLPEQALISLLFQRPAGMFLPSRDCFGVSTAISWERHGGLPAGLVAAIWGLHPSRAGGCMTRLGCRLAYAIRSSRQVRPNSRAGLAHARRFPRPHVGHTTNRQPSAMGSAGDMPCPAGPTAGSLICACLERTGLVRSHARSGLALSTVCDLLPPTDRYP